MGLRSYELTYHLGNGLAVVSDLKWSSRSANVLSAQDYYLFGMVMPGRNYSDVWGMGMDLMERNVLQGIAVRLQ